MTKLSEFRRELETIYSRGVQMGDIVLVSNERIVNLLNGMNQELNRQLDQSHSGDEATLLQLKRFLSSSAGDDKKQSTLMSSAFKSSSPASNDALTMGSSIDSGQLQTMLPDHDSVADDDLLTNDETMDETLKQFMQHGASDDKSESDVMPDTQAKSALAKDVDSEVATVNQDSAVVNDSTESHSNALESSADVVTDTDTNERSQSNDEETSSEEPVDDLDEGEPEPDDVDTDTDTDSAQPDMIDDIVSKSHRDGDKDVDMNDYTSQDDDDVDDDNGDFDFDFLNGLNDLDGNSVDTNTKISAGNVAANVLQNELNASDTADTNPSANLEPPVSSGVSATSQNNAPESSSSVPESVDPTPSASSDGNRFGEV